MTSKRTEEDKVVQAGIPVILGGKEYQIAPLVIRESRIWRAKVVKVLAALPQFFGVTSDAPEQFEQAITAILVTNADVVVDLFFDYARALSREEIEVVASDAELAVAWEQIVEVAFPLAKSLVGMMTKLSQ